MNWRALLSSWLTNPTNKVATPIHWRQEHAEAKVSVLQQGIEEALTFFHQFHPKKSLRKKLPWVLFLGTESAGKTSLLAMSHLEIKSLDNRPLSKPHPTAYCDWWFSKDAVLIDVAGSLVLPEDPKNDSHLIWQKFIQLLSTYRKKNTISSLVLCVDLREFLNKNRGQRQLQIDIFRHRIQLLAKYLNQLPIYLIFTKCDQITGFTDSFNALSPEDCLQPFGISLAYGINQHNFTAYLEKQFNAFLRRLNEQLINRLHHEHNLEKRGHIKNFPLQLESQKRDIIHLAAQLHSSKTSLTGVYFTSSLQDGKNANALNKLSYSFGLPTLTNIETIEYLPQKKAFFIHQILQKIIDKKIYPTRKIPLFLIPNNRQFYISLISLLALASIFMIPSYIHNQKILSEIQAVLISDKSSPQNTLINHIPPTLSTLNMLQNANHNFLKRYTNPLLTLAFNEGNSLQNELHSRYKNALTTQFTPFIKLILENQIRDNQKLTPQQLFSVLKLYLMLGDTQHFNKDFILTWFKHYWAQILPQHEDTQQQLYTHLTAWLELATTSFSTNPHLVTLGRQTLNRLPLTELVYLVLQENIEEADAKMIPAANVNHAYFSLPLSPLYTASHFDDIYQNVIPELAKRIATGDDWVLNLRLPVNLTQPLITQLTENIRKLYVRRYSAYWQLQVLNIQIGQFKNLIQVREFFNSFSNHESPLLALLNIVNSNLKPLSHFDQAREVNEHIQQLRQLLETSQHNTALTQALQTMDQYLGEILQSKDSPKATLLATQNHMRNPGSTPISKLISASQSLPEPLNNWFHSSAINTWKTMLVASQNYLNLQWITQILPVYREQIKDQYPVFKDASQEISLKSFANFFGPNGTVDQFFNENLAPFVDSTQLYWQWKTQDGYGLTIPQATLEMLNRAALIRQMYFPDNKQTLSIQFNLSPNALALLAEKYTLNVDGQVIDYSSDFRQQKNISWPKAQSNASLVLEGPQGTKILFNETGPWALFKLLSHAQIESAGNVKSYHVKFDAQGTSVTYDLNTEQVINPFIPDILNGFRCPEKL